MARIHPETTLEYIESFDRGKTVVSSRRGSVTIAVNPDDGVPKGMVWLPIHHPAVNALTLPVVDPESDEPNLKQCAVDVRRRSRRTRWSTRASPPWTASPHRRTTDGLPPPSRGTRRATTGSTAVYSMVIHAKKNYAG